MNSFLRTLLVFVFLTAAGFAEDDFSETKKKAEVGDASAQYNLGVMYDTGTVVPKDYAEAMSWYRKAADQGYASAQYNLGVMYYKGRGLPKDLVQAHAWWNITGAGGDETAKKDCANIEKEMTPEQQAEAMKLARELFAKLPSAPSRDPSKDEAADRAEQLARAEQVPLNGFEKVSGKSEDGIAMNKAKSKSPTTNAEQALEGDPNSKNAQGGLVAVQQTSQAQSKQRPRLASASLNQTIPLTTRLSGVDNAGIVSRDARWSEHGEYLNEMLEIIRVTWYRILEESRVSPPRGSHVMVTFKINAKGETDIVKVENADSGKQAVFSCQNAITYPQPYRKWSQQMIAVLGEQQELTIAFYYQ